MTRLALLPGLGNTPALFDPMLEILQQEYGFALTRALGVNLRDPEMQNFDQLLDVAAAQIPVEPIDILGFSMGGYVALGLVLSGRIRVRRLILVNTRAAADGAEEAADRARMVRLLANAKVRYEGLTPSAFAGFVHSDFLADAAMFDHVRQMALAVGTAGLIGQLRAVQVRPDFRPGLAGITCPTLIIAGDGDQRTPPGQSVEMAEGIRAAQLHILKRCGHLSPLERPKQVSALLSEFLTL